MAPNPGAELDRLDRRRAPRQFNVVDYLPLQRVTHRDAGDWRLGRLLWLGRATR